MKLILVLLLLLSSVVLVHSVDAKSKDSKAKSAITKAIGRGVEGRYASIDMVNVSKINDSSVIVVYNKTAGSQPSPSPTPTPIPPNPTPIPPTSGFKLCMAGDFKDSSVFDAMKSNGCNYRIALGDMGYASDLSLVKKIAPDRAVCGNHDSKEDGSATIEKECLAFAGNSWYQKIGSTLILGFNTNGVIAPQLDAAKKLLFDNQFMAGIKNVIALSHKNGHVFPNAHHPSEASSLYSQLESIVPQGITLWEVGGHNHDSASADLMHWYIAGSGGKSFYACGKDANWTFCDNKTKAFLQFTIDNNGNITPNFIDTSGKVLN